jgi:hypothetical protein
MPSSAQPASPNQSQRSPLLWLLGILAAAVAARAWLLFSTPLVPGMNGAYYLVQARSLLEICRSPSGSTPRWRNSSSSSAACRRTMPSSGR